MNNIKKREIAQLISAIENDRPGAEKTLDNLWPKCGGAYRIGITGPPGAGKSTLVEKLAKNFINDGKTVALIMVDPSSPFSGGALLGDRLRLNNLSSDPNIFIRSMATRGSLGGLSRKTEAACDILDAYGFDIILIETVGVGQIELDVAQASDIAVVVLVPESGDEIQAMKAGLMEIAGIFAINKADREGAGRMEINLRSMLALRKISEQGDVPVFKTVATKGEGINDLYDSILSQQKMLKEKQIWQDIRKRRFKERIRFWINDELLQRFWTDVRKEECQMLTDSDQPLSPIEIGEKILKL